jgi:uncharacterized RDD family membrane protein YckC
LQQPFGPGASTNQNYALWPERALGYILDSLLVGVPTFLVAIIYSVVVGVMTHAAMGAPGGAAMVGASTGMSCLLTLLFPLVAVGISFWNRGYLVGKRGYSIGQGLVHVKVVDAEGRPVTMGVAMLRVLAHIGLSFVPLAGLIDLLWPLWDPQVQTLHDKVVKCFVVKDSARR